MWIVVNSVLIGLSLLSVSLTTFGQSLDEEGIRCYDCNSFNPHCREHVNQSNPDDGFAVFTRCPITQRCFIRRDPEGVIVRGCADGWRFSLVDIEYMGCKEQSVDWLGPQVWCFCEGDLCNQVPMGQLNQGQYMQLAQSSEYLSVDTDLDVKHELTGWVGQELLEKQVESSTTESQSTSDTSTKTMTTKKQSTFTASPLTKSTRNQTISTNTSTTQKANVPTNMTTNSTLMNSTDISSNVTLDISLSSSTPATKDPTLIILSNTTRNNEANSSNQTTLKSTSKPTYNTTKLTTFRASTSENMSNATKNPNDTVTDEQTDSNATFTTPLFGLQNDTDDSSINSTVSTERTTTEKDVALPWWLWHVVSSTAKPTKTSKFPMTTASTAKKSKHVTRTSKATTTAEKLTTRRSYMKPKVVLVTKTPTGTDYNTLRTGRQTTPSVGSERWTWSPSWWDKWWRPGTRRPVTRRPRKQKRPVRKYTKRPRPTQGKGHYWWLAPVGPTVLPPKHRLPATKRVTYKTSLAKTSSKRTVYPSTTSKPRTTSTTAATTTKRTIPTMKTKPSLPPHLMPSRTPAPVREYPRYPQWGRRINSNKSIYPVMTKRQRPSTKFTTRRKVPKITTRKIRITPTRPAPTTVKVTTRRRRPTTISRRRMRTEKRKPRPNTQQRDSDPFFCWDCYSASTNCRDVVNSPYSYYVGRTPCPYTRKCFVRKDNNVVYRGCADGWTSSLIESNYNGCKIQYTWGRPVEWCFCDSNLCNGQSLKHIKDKYPIKEDSNVVENRKEKKRPKFTKRTGPL